MVMAQSIQRNGNMKVNMLTGKERVMEHNHFMTGQFKQDLQEAQMNQGSEFMQGLMIFVKSHSTKIQNLFILVIIKWDRAKKEVYTFVKV